MLDPLYVWTAAAATAVLLGHAAVGKLLDAGGFAQRLAAYRVPAALAAPLARMLPLAEAAAAVLLCTRWRTAGAALAVLLLAGYAAAMAWQRLHGRRPDCGCGGGALPVSWPLVVRNLALAALAGVAAAPVAARPLGVADAFVVAGAVLVGTLLYAALHQLLRLPAGPRPAHPPRRT